jgi:DNA-binding response OmpR family regulator/GGDEF domain-containing protein
MNSDEIKECTKSISILYVDKRDEIDKDIVEFLKDFFLQVSVYIESHKALEAHRTSKFDIIMLGLDIADITTLEFIKEIKSINKSQHIVVTSSHAQTKTLLSLLNLGIDKFLPKPHKKKSTLSVLYGITKQVLCEMEFESNNKDNTKAAKEYKKIINVVDTGIIVVDENSVIEVNKFALKTLKLETMIGVENLLLNLKEHIIKADGYVYTDQLSELVMMTKDSGNCHRLLLKAKGEGDNTVLMFSCSTIETMQKYVIAFTDVTALDNQDRYNQLTKLPNQVDFIDKIEKYKDDTYDLLALGIKNYSAITRWHGKTAGFEVEKQVADFLATTLHDMKIDDSTYVANNLKNQYIIILKKEKLKEFVKRLSILGEYTATRVDSNSEKKDINLAPSYKVIDFVGVDTNDVLIKLEEENDLMEE